MPELAFSYLIGLVVAVAVVTATYVWNQHKLSSKEVLILNQNLQKIGKFWSHSEGNVLDGDLQSIEKDFRSSKNSFLVLGALLCIGSWLGLIAFLLTIYSLKKITMSELELKIFKSPLATSIDLTSAQAKEEFEKLQ